MRRILMLFLIIVVICMQLYACTNKFSQLEDIKIVDNEYIIDTVIDLKGKAVTIPANKVIHFKRGGMIDNGIIIGNNTKILGDSIGIFGEVTIKGTWIVNKISTKMFNKVDIHILGNISNLCSEKTYNEIFIEDDCEVEISNFSSPFIIKSKTNLHLKSNIYTKPSKFKGGYALYIRGDSINIFGNHYSIIGTLNKDKTNREQWQHGICLNFDASNVYIEKIKCREFWGDGIYNRGSNITINGVECYFNGRQGLSITYGKNIRIINSKFHHTGKYGLNNSNGPGAGIDIEPNAHDIVDNVTLENCVFYCNNKRLFGDDNDLMIYRAFDSNIKIINCSMKNLYIGKSSVVSIKNSKIKNMYKFTDDVSNIYMETLNVKSIIDNKLKLTKLR